MWEAIWALLEKLIPQIPTRADMDRSIEGLLNKLPKVSRQPDRPQPIAPLDREERQAGQRALNPLQRAEQINDQSAGKLSKLQQMLNDLGNPKPEEQSNDSGGARHVIVDNAKDLKPDPPREVKGPEPAKASGESPSSRLDGLMKKLEQMQSPEWRSLTDAERNSRFSQRFTSNRADWSKLLRTNESGDVHFRWQKTQQAPAPYQPAPVAPPRGQRAPRSIRQRLGTIWKWKTRPQKMINWGRKLQIGAGRLMAVGGGNRTVSSLAAGMSRLGLLLQGVGTSRVAAGAAAPEVAGLAGLAGMAGLAMALPSAVSGLWSLTKATRAAGEGLLQDQQRLAPFSGVQSQAAMITSISQIRTDMAAARDTGENTVELAREMTKLRKAMQPLESMFKNIELKAATWGASFGTGAAEELREALAMPANMKQWGQELMENPLAWLLGGDDAVKQLEQQRERERRAAQQQQQQQPLLPAQEFLQGLRQAMQLPGGQRRPLDPL